LDAVTTPEGRRETPAARIRLAGQEAGILPDDPLVPFVDAVAQAVHEIDYRLVALPGQITEAMAPLVSRTEQLIRVAERAADRPLLTDVQIKSAMPHLLASIGWSKAMIGALLLIAAFEGGHLYSTWGVPETHCFNQQGGVFCGYWQSPPTQGSK
jgi:hypothetical protein